jgi:hypothetical protein
LILLLKSNLNNGGSGRTIRNIGGPRDAGNAKETN